MWQGILVRWKINLLIRPLRPMQPPFSLFCTECVLVCLVVDLDFWVLWKGDQKGRRIHLHGFGLFIRIGMMNRSLSIGTCRWQCIWLLHQGRLHSSLTVWLLLWLWLRWLYFVQIRCRWGEVGLGHQWILSNTGDTLYFFVFGWYQMVAGEVFLHRELVLWGRMFWNYVAHIYVARVLDGMAMGNEINRGLQGCILAWIIHMCVGCNTIWELFRRFFACPISVHTFVVCSENVTEMSCMFSPYALDTKIIDDESKRDRAFMVAP